MKTDFGIQLSRNEMKKVLGGMRPPGCSISLNCYQTVYNFDTRKYEDKQIGSISCDGATDCSGGVNNVSCPQANGTTDTASCPPGSHTNVS